MKTSKKLVSLFLALVLLVGMFSISAMAAADEGTVTVYITKGMFSVGGWNEENGEPNPQIYESGKRPEENLLVPGSTWCAQTLTINQIVNNLPNTQGIYHGVTGEMQVPNLLDAIITALQNKSEGVASPVTEIVGGWDDSDPTNPGGYINNFTPYGQPTYGETYTFTDPNSGEKYTVYNGTGFQIAYGQLGSVKEIPLYGTNYGLENGLIIVFDLSPYSIYYPAS